MKKISHARRLSLASGWSLGQCLEQIAALEVCVGVDNCVQIRLAPCSVLLDLLDLILVAPFEYPVARDVIPLLADILPHPTKNFLVMNPGGLK